MTKLITIFLILAALTLSGCATVCTVVDGIVPRTRISQEQAMKIMAADDVIILDVRTEEEFLTGHIPGSVNLPLHELSITINYLITDSEQIILIYCRSGVRSADAMKILIDMGYHNVFDFGGIIHWTGEIVN